MVLGDFKRHLSAFWKKIVALATLVCFSQFGFSQQNPYPYEVKQPGDSSTTTRWFDRYYPKLQYEASGINNVSFGLGLVKVYEDFVIWRVNGPFIDCGVGFKDQKLLLTNKIGYEYYWLILAARLNIVNYTDFSTDQLAFRPEVGLTVFTKLTVTYGYNFFRLNKDPLNIKGHILSINIGYL